MGLSVSKAAREARISRVTWAAVESGTRETEAYNYGVIQRVLGWAPGSVDAVLAGGEPTVLLNTNDQPAPAYDQKALVKAIVEVLGSRFSDATKLKMIQDIVLEYWPPSDGADALGEVADAGHSHPSAVAE